jgi:hypothetical protein
MSTMFGFAGFVATVSLLNCARLIAHMAVWRHRTLVSLLACSRLSGAGRLRLRVTEALAVLFLGLGVD